MSHAPTPASQRPSKGLLTLTLIPIVVVAVMAQIGARTGLATIADHPLLTLALNPTKAVMVAASPQLGDLEYYLTVFIRSVFVDPFWFMIGVWYGDAAIRWMRRRMPSYGQLAEQLETSFPQFGWIFVLLYSSSPLVILLAGASTMRLWVFLALDLAGTGAVAFGVRQLGWVVQDQVAGAVGFLDKYQPWFIALSVVLLAHMAWEFWSTRDKRSVAAMEAGLEKEAHREDYVEADRDDDPTDESSYRER